MKTKNNTAAISAAILTAITLAAPARATPQPAGDRPAFRADDFVEFIGLAASPFEKDMRDKFPPETFFDLGVRHYRTGICGPMTTDNQHEEVALWWRKTGARPTMLIDTGRARTVKTDWLNVPADGDFSHLIELIKRYPAGSVGGIEAPNEVNNKFPPQDLNLKYKGETDERAGALYQNDLHAAMKADPATREIPLIMYSAIFTDYTLARPCDAFDYMNMHSYQGSGVPSSSLRQNIAHAARLLPDGAVIKPFMPTECGYNVEEDVSNHTGLTGSLRAQAYNVPMLLAEYFRHGIARAYLFALHNADGYGLLESGGNVKRPSWHALQSFTRILADARWNPDALAWEGAGRTFAPRALRFTLEGAPATVRSLTLQKADGDWFLLLWNEVRNNDRDRDLAPPAAPVKIRFADGFRVECVARYEQGELTGDTAAMLANAERGAFAAAANPPTTAADGALALNIPSRVVILQLRGSAPAPASASAPPAAPRFKNATATENSAAFTAVVPKNHNASSIIVSRLGLHIATLPLPPSQNAAGEIELPFKDESPWLEPALGYTYELRAIAPDGGQSAPAAAIINTSAKRADFVIDSFGSEQPPAAIRAGDKVTFRGAIRNIGDGATPRPFPISENMYNNTVAITFSVDGRTVSWGGDSGDGGPMLPGQTYDCRAGGGPNNANHWLAAEGAHIIKAQIDDINRIPSERDKANNTRSKTLVIGDYAGKLEMESELAAPLHIQGAQLQDWVHFAGWNGDGETRRKPGANLISEAVKTGEGHVAVNPGCAIPISIDAEGDLPAVRGSHAGLWGNVQGNGYTFTVPADTTERELKVYTGVTAGGHGEFSASLSDDSAPAFVDTTWNANRSNQWSPVPGELAVCHTLRYRAATPGQTLTITWKLIGDPNRFRSQIRLQAATLRSLAE